MGKSKKTINGQKVEFRAASETDIPALKSLWAQAFADSQAYIDDYFARIFRAEETLVLVRENQVLSMLTRIPVNLRLASGGESDSPYPGYMFYAIATDQAQQGQGLASALIDYANSLALESGRIFSVIVPATVELFSFYQKQGYERAFYICQKDLNLDRGQSGLGLLEDSPAVDKSDKVHSHRVNRCLGPKNENKAGIRLDKISPEAYNQARRGFLAGSNYIDYEEREIYRQKAEGEKGSVDIYRISVDKSQAQKAEKAGKSLAIKGLLAAERVSDSEIMIKELLLSDKYIADTLLELARISGASKFILRRPVPDGIVASEEVTPFALFKDLGVGDLLMDLREDEKKGKLAYLGLAFD